MTIQEAREVEWTARSEMANPFAETAQATEEPVARTVGFTPWSETFTPFAEAAEGFATESESDRMLAEAFAELRDETFDEAIAYLTEETEQAVADRFTNESPATSQERERYADAHLASVRFEADQYLETLESGLTGSDLESMTDEQLDEMLDRFDPQTGELTPAGEEFVGALVRKAKKVVKFVKNTAKSVGKVAGSLLGPILRRLRRLVNPLLRRVLSFAIGRLPAALQPAARALATRITSESAEQENLDEGYLSPTNLTDVEVLAESFDAALAEAMISDESLESETEALDERDSEAVVESRELEILSEARGVLIDRIHSAQDEEDLAPAVEQFIPALLAALRVGINLVGRAKVVGFLAKYLGNLIRRWVGPKLSGPLSNAIVDTGLRLISLEAESAEAGESRNDEAGPVALASVIEDTVRRLAENEDYIFENEELMQLATANAFSQAVATHFPARFVRPGLQQAPSIGGTFIARRPRSVRTYRKYTRIPEVEVTEQIANALPTFGGSTVGASLRAVGATFPFRARMHIYQAAVGTTLPRMVRLDRAKNGAAHAYATSSSVHPLTPAVAGLLLREPQFGPAVPAGFLRSRHRIAVGQRFYVLEPIGRSAGFAVPTSRNGQAVVRRLAPSRAWIAVSLRRSRITVGLYLSEADAQSIAAAHRQARGGPALLQALITTYGMTDRSPAGSISPTDTAREDGEDLDGFLPRLAPLNRNVASLRRQLRAWVLPALAAWAGNNGEAFARAAAHPDAGVTVLVRLTDVPGLELGGQIKNVIQGSAIGRAVGAARRKPAVTISVASGMRRR